MSSSPKPPPAPDYEAAAEAEAGGNMAMARYTTGANRVNQVTPWGQVNYDMQTSFDQAGYDAALADYQANGSDGPAPRRENYMRDTWTQTESLDPKLQAALDQQLALQQARSQTAGDMLGRVQDAYSEDFDAPLLQSFLQGIPGVDTSSVGRAGNFSSNAQVNGLTGTSANAVEQGGVGTVGNFSTDANINTNINQFLSGLGVNLNAPQFSNGRQDEYAKAAYESQMALLRSDLDAQDERTNNRLALQGLTPGSEASDNALSSFYDARSRQLNQIANQSVLTGNELNNRDYSSQLGGFRAGNEAVGQQFAQALSQFKEGNDAQAQKFSLGDKTFQNNLQAILSNNQLQQARNAASQQAFDRDLNFANFNNQTALQQFGMDQATYDNSLNALKTNAGLQEAQNRAQQQAYAQALSNYGTEWQQAQTLRNMPLNEMNALLTGQQVQSPSYQPYSQQAMVGGPAYGDATRALGDWNTGVYNADAANASAQNGQMAGLAGTAMMALAMY
jgi:hypothetical protein